MRSPRRFRLFSTPSRLFFSAAALFFVAAGLQAQVRQNYFDQPMRFVLPDDYRSDKAYPLIISLPWTGGTAEEFFEYYSRSFEGMEAILMFPPGRPLRDHYLPDFLSFVDWYDGMVHRGMEYAFEHYSVNPSAVYLMGYSLGGDLGWALINRHPDEFAAAAMFGTRSSYPVREENLRILHNRGARAFFGIGSSDIADRKNGIYLAYNSFRDAGIPSRIAEYSAGHYNPPDSLMNTAISFLEIPAPVSLGLSAAEVIAGATGSPTQGTPGASTAGASGSSGTDQSGNTETDASAGTAADFAGETVAGAESFSAWTSDRESWFTEGFNFKVDDDWDSWAFEKGDFFDSDFTEGSDFFN